MSQSCIFCKIVDGSIPSPRVLEDESFICIRDLHPQAKIHLLVIPKKHVAGLDAAYAHEGGAALVGALFEFGTQVAHQQRLLPQGFRSIINTGVGGGQTVFHLHLHLLGGGELGERLA